MKRNPDLIREILMELEQEDSVAPPMLTFDRDGGEQETRARHVLLAEEAGLLTHAAQSPVSNLRYLFPSVRLTNAGYDFLDVIRTESGWSKLKARAAAAGGVGLQFLVGVATAVVADQIKTA